MHEGTTKIYVNFVPVADISDMGEEMFKLIQKRAVDVDGILFCDPGMLRMFMYLELSRPRGEVERWHKVFQRLTLLNHEYPLEDCKDDITMQHLDTEVRKIILDFCVKRKNVMVGPEFIELLDKNKAKTHIDTLAKQGGPVIFLSAKAKEEAEDLRDILQGKGAKLQIEEFTSPSDHVFNYVMLKRKGEKIALIFQEDSCHAYTLLTVDGGAEMRVATPDMLLHLYYTLMIFGKKILYLEALKSRKIIMKFQKIQNHFHLFKNKKIYLIQILKNLLALNHQFKLLKKNHKEIKDI
jgi:hypothetical protein